MTPSHVIVQRCTGGCSPLNPSCLPSQTRMKKIPVIVAKCGIKLGKGFSRMSDDITRDIFSLRFKFWVITATKVFSWQQICVYYNRWVIFCQIYSFDTKYTLFVILLVLKMPCTRIYWLEWKKNILCWILSTGFVMTRWNSISC